MLHLEDVEAQLATLVKRHAKLRSRLKQSIDMRSAAVEDPASCPPPSLEITRQRMQQEESIEQQMYGMALTIKTLRWVLGEEEKPI
jgi:hypothetical protein